MAKVRQTDVNINYKVNDVEIQRSNQLLNRASKATDDLRKTTATFNTQAAQGYRFTSRAIEGMEIEVARLKQQVKLANTQNTAEAQRLSAQYRSAKQQLDAYNKSLLETSKISKQTSVAAQGMANQFGQVYSTMRAIIAAGLAKELVASSLAMAKLSGTIEGVTHAFDKLPNSTLLLEGLRKATHGTITDLELMQKALRANNFRIPLEQLGVLLEFAAVKAQQTGQEVNHLVEYIVSGIGYRSIKRLDDLGFTANRVKEALGDVSLQAASMGQIMNAVTKLMNEDMSETGGFLETSATQVGVLERKWHELNETVSEFGTQPGLLRFYDWFLTNFTAGINFLIGGSKKVNAEAAKDQAIAEVQGFKQMHITEEVLKNKEKALEIVKHESNVREGLIFRNEHEIRQLEQRMKFIDGVYSGEVKIKDELDAKGIKLKDFLDDLRAEESRIQEQLPFYQHKNLILKESVRILKEYMDSLKMAPKDDPTAEGDGDNKRGMLMKPLTQVVDIRFKDPKTGRITKEHNDKVLQDFIAEGQKVIDAIGPFHITVQPFIPMSDWEKALEANREDIINTSSGIIQEQIDSILFSEVDAYNQRIAAARNFYDEQVALAGDNERAKQELRIKEEREIQKLEKAALASIRVNTALSIIKVFAGGGTFVDKLIRAALVTAQGASQYAAASRARYYAKGEIDIKGPGTKTSDSIPAFLSKGESIMTADETVSSRGIFKAVRAKKLNDRVLKDIVSGRSGGTSVTFDDSKIVKGLQDLKNSQPDLLQRANLAYEIRKRGDNYKKIIRSRSIRS